jgi:hypothetical protein
MPPPPNKPLDRPAQFRLKAYAVVFLAGLASEVKLRGEELDPVNDPHPDAARTRQIVDWMLADNPAQVEGYLRGELTITTLDFLENWQPSISDVTAAALNEGHLSAERIRQLIAPAIVHRRRLSAYHEAGHAVILWLEGNGQIPMSVGIGQLPMEGGQNWTILRPFSADFYLQPLATDPKDRQLAHLELQRIVAGEEMAKLVDPTYPGRVLAWADREEAHRLARKLVHEGWPTEQAQQIEADARAEVRGRLREANSRALVEALVSALLERSPLGEDEIRHVFSPAGGPLDSK